MILLTGATGTVGQAVARRLTAEEPVRVLTRDPARASELTAPHIEVVGADFNAPSSLARALKGVRAALLVTSDPLTHAHDEHFVAAARRAGVRHVVKLSALAVTDPDADDLITRWQRGNEELLRASGLGWTFLRPRAFMSNTLAWARSIREEGLVRALYSSSANAVVDPRDIADVAASALSDTERHGGRVHPLTGPSPVSAADQTRILAELLEQPLRCLELTERQAHEQLLARYPAAVAEALMESAARQRAGAKARVEPETADRLGRPPTDFRDWAADHLEIFTG